MIKSFQLQYSCLENPMDRGTWQVQSLGLPKKKKSFHISLRRITSGTKWSFYMAVGHKPTSLFNLQVRIWVVSAKWLSQDKNLLNYPRRVPLIWWDQFVDVPLKLEEKIFLVGVWGRFPALLQSAEICQINSKWGNLMELMPVLKDHCWKYQFII